MPSGILAVWETLVRKRCKFLVGTVMLKSGLDSIQVVRSNCVEGREIDFEVDAKTQKQVFGTYHHIFGEECFDTFNTEFLFGY